MTRSQTRCAGVPANVVTFFKSSKPRCSASLAVWVVTRTAHASQVSDAVLDACLEQDPYAKAITHLFF